MPNAVKRNYKRPSGKEVLQLARQIAARKGISVDQSIEGFIDLAIDEALNARPLPDRELALEARVKALEDALTYYATPQLETHECGKHIYIHDGGDKARRALNAPTVPLSGVVALARAAHIAIESLTPEQFLDAGILLAHAHLSPAEVEFLKGGQ